MSNSIQTKAKALTNLVDFEVIEYAFYLSQLDSGVEFVDVHLDDTDEDYSPEEKRRAVIEFVLANLDTLISDCPDQLYDTETTLYKKLVTIYNENYL